MTYEVWLRRVPERVVFLLQYGQLVGLEVVVQDVLDQEVPVVELLHDPHVDVALVVVDHLHLYLKLFVLLALAREDVTQLSLKVDVPF